MTIVTRVRSWADGPSLLLVMLVVIALGALGHWVLHVVNTPEANGSTLGQTAASSEKSGTAAQGEDAVAAVKQAGKLRILTIVDPKTYYEGVDGHTGFEYELTRAYADHLGVEAEFVTKPSIPALFEALGRGEGDLIAAGLMSGTPTIGDPVAGPAYDEATEVVACRRGVKLPEAAADLGGYRVLATKGSAAEHDLKELVKKDGTIHPSYVAAAPVATLKALAAGAGDCAMVNSLDFKVGQPYSPNLQKAFDFGDKQPVAWALAEKRAGLYDSIDAWLSGFRKSGDLDALKRGFFGYLPRFDYVDARAFKRAIQQVLPKYVGDFKEAERVTGLPWRLIAAVAYQESHWDPDARSPTGVRGMMMLTSATAEEVGVKNLDDAEESILGGARYLKSLLDRVPEEVPLPDRYWFMLAGYNMGFGHVWDARTLAKERGLNPDKWFDLRQTFPTLETAAADRLPHGRGNGYQALHYVQNIRTYLHVLERLV